MQLMVLVLEMEDRSDNVSQNANVTTNSTSLFGDDKSEWTTR